MYVLYNYYLKSIIIINVFILPGPGAAGDAAQCSSRTDGRWRFLFFVAEGPGRKNGWTENGAQAWSLIDAMMSWGSNGNFLLYWVCSSVCVSHGRLFPVQRTIKIRPPVEEHLHYFSTLLHSLCLNS